LRQCVADHSSCGTRNHGVKLPSRLLELHSNAIRLREACEVSRNMKYATLSHCWGPRGVEAKLTKELLEDFRANIRPESLPRTFQDAISITRRLGLAYLWIDSLCIIQDDPVDWEKESISMSEVYGNSWVNIAASWAKDCSEGCLYRSNPKIDRFQVEVKAWQDRQVRLQTLEVIPANMVLNSISMSVLSDRGWVLQERLLSPRTLHFTKAQIFWECNTLLGCESFPNGVPACTTVSDIHIVKNNLSEQWHRIITKYTRCNLTQRRDVLVAMSGIIKRLQEQRQDICVAGIWRQDPEMQLLWMRSPSDVQKARYLYTAPTWSWASSQGPIQQQE
ncbi:HET-domain-containing protein, partial [Mollisia scopiformis]